MKDKGVKGFSNVASNIFYSLAFKIGSVVIVIEVIVFITTGVYYIKHFSNQLEKTVETELQIPSILINQGVLTFEAIENKVILSKIIRGELEEGLIIGLNHRIFYALSAEFKGQLVESIEKLSFPNNFLDFSINDTKIVHETNKEGSFLHTLSPLFVLDGKTPRFFVYLKLNTSWIEKEKRDLILSFSLTSFISIFITSLLIFLFFRHMIFSKLIELTKASSAVKKGVFDIAIEGRLLRSKDELGVLAQSFSSMTKELQQSTTSIDNLNKEIEVRKEVEDMLRKAEENYRKLFDSGIDAIFVINSQTDVILDCNLASTTLTERDKSELVHQPHRILYPEEDPTNVKPMDFLREAIGKRLEIKLITKTGNIKDAELRASYLEVGNTKVIQGIFRDISDAKRAVQERERLTNELHQARRLESLGTLAAGIAHEINTPIQFIGDNIRFVQDEISNLFSMIANYKKILRDCDAQNLTISAVIKQSSHLEEASELSYIQEEFPLTFKQTLEGVERVRTIVNAMKNFSHMGKDVKSFADINESINSTIAITRNEWKHIATVEKDLDLNLPLVNCFPADINQAIMNLIINACHAIRDMAEQSKETGKIIIATRKIERELKISIQDTGCGIPEGVRDKIFDPFFTTKEIGKGTGQGLTLVYQTIVEKHEGTITFESEIGRGTTFYITLPLE